MSSVPINPGLAIGSIAAASGTEIVATALGVASVLGNIGSPKTAIPGPIGEEFSTGVHLLVVGADCPHWHHAQQLLLRPVESCQQHLRDLSASVAVERFENLHGYPQMKEGTNALLDSCDGDIFSASNFTPLRRRFEVLRNPTFCLRCPSAASFQAAQPETLDSQVFIYAPDGG